MSDFRVGMRVHKLSGYPFPGTVVSVFKTLAGATRLVVESEVAPGMLHIFNETQLRFDSGELACTCGHARRRHGRYNDRWFGDRTDVYACMENMGMGDPCGCEKRYEEED